MWLCCCGYGISYFVVYFVLICGVDLWCFVFTCGLLGVVICLLCFVLLIVLVFMLDTFVLTLYYAVSCVLGYLSVALLFVCL